jgi:hypothetical protein
MRGLGAIQMLARSARPLVSYYHARPPRGARQAQKNPAWHGAKRGRGDGTGSGGVAAWTPNTAGYSAAGQVNRMAGNSGRAMALGVKRLPVKLAPCDSGDAEKGEGGLHFGQHGKSLHEKMGAGGIACPLGCYALAAAAAASAAMIAAQSRARALTKAIR